MWQVFRYTLAALRAAARERRALALENIALRHQIEVLTRNGRRPQQVDQSDAPRRKATGAGNSGQLWMPPATIGSSRLSHTSNLSADRSI